MTKLANYFQLRKKGETECEKMVGVGNVTRLAAVHDRYKDEIECVETAVMVQASESCAYSSEELRIFKTGLKAITHFIAQCKEENELKNTLKQQAKQQEKEKASKKKNRKLQY
jgi:gas vesicle protein